MKHTTKPVILTHNRSQKTRTFKSPSAAAIFLKTDRDSVRNATTRKRDNFVAGTNYSAVLG